MTRLLIVDDDVLALQLMAKAAGLLGYQSIVTTSARSGLRMAESEHPDIILVDLQMDEMDGAEFVRRVRAAPAIAHLPVLICSAGSSLDDEAYALRAGADGFISKPVSIDQLRKTVQSFTQAGGE